MNERLLCPQSGQSCEFEGYCAIMKDLLSPGTQLARDKARLLEGASPEWVDLIGRTYGYCSEGKISACREVLEDPTKSIDAKSGALISIDVTTREREAYHK